MMMRRSELRSRGGFTLIELVVSLSLTGGVLLVAASLLSVCALVTDTTEAAVTASDLRHGSERYLRQVVGQFSWPEPGDPPPAHARRELRFASWCDSALGWTERCIVTLRVSNDDSVLGVGVSANGMVPQTLFPMDTVSGFLYLDAGGPDGSWSETWDDASQIPAAVGLVFPRDTLIVRTGYRG